MRASQVHTRCVVPNIKMNDTSAAFYLRLYLAMHSDVALHPSYNLESAIRDQLEIVGRVAAEGMEFLTKTMPAIGKAVDKALADGQILDLPLLKKQEGSAIPVFLGPLFERLFDSKGLLRSDADPDALASLRQLTYFLYKLELPYTDEQKRKVLSDFVACDRGLADLDILGSGGSIGTILDTASRLANRVLGSFDPREINPKHGPGAVATGEKAWQKKVFKRYYQQLAAFYPYEEYFYFNSTHLCDELSHYLNMPELKAGTAKVVLVPKDSRGPRLISCEPLEYQWIQQGLGRAIMSHLETNRWTAGYVNFTDQSINQRLALDASVTQKWATLDMKEASDRVSLELVFALFQRLPVLMRALCATRTVATRLPNGETVELNKFAPMGSALCFPVESFAFWALSVAALHIRGKLSLKEAAKRVYVYGDDIVCRLEDHELIVTCLEEVGLLVNRDKSCTTGFFRESCGVDAFKGVDVTPVKIRRLYDHRTPECLESWSAYQRALDKRHYYETSQFLQRELLDRGLHYVDERFTFETETQSWGQAETESVSVAALVSYVRPNGWDLYSPYPKRWNNKFHRSEVKVPVLVTAQHVAPPSAHDWREMLRVNSVHSLRVRAGVYPIRRRVTLMRRWRNNS